MTKFKGILTIVVFTILGISIIIGCSKNNSIYRNNQQDFPSASNVGEVHNASLDYVLTQFKKANLKSSSNEEALIDSVISYTKSYLITNEGIASSEIDEIIDLIGIKSGELDISQLLSSMTDNDFKNMLTDIIDIFDSEIPLSYSELDNALNLIEISATMSNYYSEILAIASVARYSYIYWEQELDNWIFLFNSNKKSINVDPRFWDIIGADAQGAVGGAICGGIAGALIGAPFASGIEGIVVVLKSL